ncbi:MAG: aspartate--tRNA(Asp/Asn) ligase [Acidimicrobiales bacterium]|nr:MAG: aspartate--tRNA(Asp/Asn) ligase [Acidimicrobiales bacterium]
MDDERLDEASEDGIPPSPKRTAWCGELREGDVGRRVAVCGWVSARREHGEHLSFVDLRDYTGVVQCVVDSAAEARTESVLRIVGTVRLRPEGTENPKIPTGSVELVDCEVEVLSRAEPPPFLPSRSQHIDETTRLRHRYLDLRSERMQRNLRTRARVLRALRSAMDSMGFVEVETPLLVAATPEGARDFLVPSRLHRGKFYALPQSPQLFKQLCMVGGVDRYYQIARCLRDEDLRADRQFEFTQLDLEASFVGPDDVIEFVSSAVASAVEEVLGTRPSFETATWHEVMERYGTDKPDLRLGMELVDVSSVFAETEARVFRAPCVKGLRVPGGADVSRARLDRLTELAKSWGAGGLAWFRVAGGGVESPLARHVEREAPRLVEAMGAEDGDLLLLVADKRPTANEVLGRLRTHLGESVGAPGDLVFLWVVDFPLFEAVESGIPRPAHHPFTMPHPEDLPMLERWDYLDDEERLSVRSLAYDLVVNGWELGSGSIRITDPAVQALVFRLLGLSEEVARKRFGFLLEAFGYGAPPHGGFALGIDRFVAVLCGEENIREVIAFPKTQSGVDPLTGAPSEPDPLQLEELGIVVPGSGVPDESDQAIQNSTTI